MSGWVKIDGKNFPPEKQTVWCYNEELDDIWLGDYCYIVNEGWFWTLGTGGIYTEGNRIIAEAELEDVEPTHWHALPELPGKEQA